MTLPEAGSHPAMAMPSDLDAILQKADEARAKLDTIGTATVKLQVDASALDTLIGKAQEAPKPLLQIPGAVASANGAIAAVPSGAAWSSGASTGRVRQALSDKHTGG